jgi:nicotinamidase-related amidase
VRPKTLFELAGLETAPTPLAGSVLVLIDYQNEYLDGPLALAGAAEAVERGSTLLAAARAAGGRIIHVAHMGVPGGPFDRAQHRGAIIGAVQPEADETVVEKPLPNAFARTDLAERIGPAGTSIVVAGFMTHMCVSSTVRAALDLGYRVTVAGDACATRDLPDPAGVVGAAELHRVELAALGDRFACVTTVEAIRSAAAA